MSVIAEIDLEADRLACAGALGEVPGVELDLEREFGTESSPLVVFLWAGASAAELDRFERALGTDPTVTDVERLSGDAEQRLFRMHLTEEVPVLTTPVWVELGAARLAMQYIDGHWRARMRFPDRESLSAFRDFCETEGLGFRLHRLCDAEGREGSVADGLTDCQREALRLAVDQGYFDLPRRTSLAELAAELEISDQAVSERLRRGCARLIRQHVD